MSTIRARKKRDEKTTEKIKTNSRKRYLKIKDYASSHRWRRFGDRGSTKPLFLIKPDNDLNTKRISDIHGFLSQKNIKTLLRQTNYTRRELYVMYVRFKALCAMSSSPDGIDRETFKKGVSRLTVEDQMFVDRVYNLVDEDMSDAIEWEEFLTAMSALEKGNIKQKLQFLFKIYDLDGDGLISRSDLSQMYLSSSMMEYDDVTQDLVDAFVDRLFNLILDNEDRSLVIDPNRKLSQKDVQRYLDSEWDHEDVWQLFGRSMLKDFKD